MFVAVLNVEIGGLNRVDRVVVLAKIVTGDVLIRQR